jgi:hypothetical protein
MPDDEIREILRRGFELLDIDAPGEIVDMLVYYSDGFPYFAHLMGLQTSRAARRSKVDTVDKEMVRAAISREMKAAEQTFAAKVKDACEVGGDVQPRRRILSLLAASEERIWKSADVIAAWEWKYEPRLDYSFLHTALAQLADAAYGAVLKRTGSRTRYEYQFTDPHMRPFLRVTEFNMEI